MGSFVNRMLSAYRVGACRTIFVSLAVLGLGLSLAAPVYPALAQTRLESLSAPPVRACAQLLLEQNQNVYIPPVFKDSYAQFAWTSDEFREYLQGLNSRNFGLDQPWNPELMRDFYKRLADSAPTYSEHPRPPVDGNGQVIPAEELPFQKLLEYLFTNYDLSDVATGHLVRLDPSLRTDEHPLVTALKENGHTQGWIARALNVIHDLFGWVLPPNPNPEENRNSLLRSLNPASVPSGRFKEIYFWDSYWIMKGLIESGYGEVAKGMLEIFVSWQEEYGIIANGGRFYYLTRTQPPLLMRMIRLLESHQILDFDHPGELETRSIKAAQEYYEKTLKASGHFQKRYGLFSYFDRGGPDNGKPVIRPEASPREPRAEETLSKSVFGATGWDMSPSRFGERPQDFLPVELNSLLAEYTGLLSTYLSRLGDHDGARKYKKESKRIQTQMKKYLWDPRTGIFRDFNFKEGVLSSVTTAASFFAFAVNGLYDENPAQAFIYLYTKLKPNGHFAIHSTDQEGPGQWDGSWAWAPLNEEAFQVALSLGLVEFADEIAFDFLLMVLRTFIQNNQQFFEKYRAIDGSIKLPENTQIYGNEVGFGWTNGTVAIFLRYLYERGKLPELERLLSSP